MAQRVSGSRESLVKRDYFVKHSRDEANDVILYLEMKYLRR